MRDLADYRRDEWMTGVPLIHRIRRLRNRLVDRVYRRRTAPGQAEVVARIAAAPGPVAVTVAFNMPEAIVFLADTMARFVPATLLVVCDNSSDPVRRAEIAAVCAARDLPYLPLPPSPYKGGRNGSRSHAVALNWILASLIRPAAPTVFAFLDHDLIPLAPADLAARVADQPCYGMRRQAEDRPAGPGAPWYLWPGYCVFRFEAVKDLPLDFGTDTPLGLDTGGQNWDVLYRRLPPDLAEARRRRVHLDDAETGESEHFLLADTWLHVGGAGHRGGGPGALARVRAAYDGDPDGFLDRLLATVGR